jgi:hypothetical protein
MQFFLTSWLDAGNTFTDRFHHTTSFVAQDAWEQSFGIVPVQRVAAKKRHHAGLARVVGAIPYYKFLPLPTNLHVSVAQSVGNHLDTNFAGLWRHHGDFFFDHGLLGATGDHGLALDGSSSGSRCHGV